MDGALTGTGAALARRHHPSGLAAHLYHTALLDQHPRPRTRTRDSSGHLLLLLLERHPLLQNLLAGPTRQPLPGWQTTDHGGAARGC